MTSRSFPLVLLLLALSTVFLFGNDRGRFYRPVTHDWVSSEHLAVAVNLSPAHNFLMFHRLSDVDEEGNLRYKPYNRFPVGGYALLSLATLPFRDDLSAQLQAARTVMLAFFAAAAVAAYHAMSRLCSSRWIALTAVLLSSSSYYHLYYNDMVHPKTMMDLFGVLLTFHGTVVFLEEGRFRQLLVKACTALLLGWHVLALILAFVVLGMASEIVRIARRKWAAESPAAGPRRGGIRRYLVFGVVPLLLAATILTLNFVNEYTANDGTVAWTKLSSVGSMTKRAGLNRKFNEIHADTVAWEAFLHEEIRRIGSLSMPFALLAGMKPAGSRLFWLGIAISAVCPVCLTFVRPRIPLASLVSSGFLWSLPMRHNTAFHDYECLFYIGIPLAVFTTGAVLTSRSFRLGPGGLSGAALLVFVLSSAEMSRVGYDAEAAGVQEALMADFEVIRRTTQGGIVYVPIRPGASAATRFAGARHALHYYLSGHVIYYDRPVLRRKPPCLPGFVVTRERVEGAALLTPENRLMFLYDRADYDEAKRAHLLCSPDGGSDRG